MNSATVEDLPFHEVDDALDINVGLGSLAEIFRIGWLVG